MFECKVIHHIKYPDKCVVGDEVGGNSSQKGDDHIGGTLHVCERNFTHQSKTSNKEKHIYINGINNTFRLTFNTLCNNEGCKILIRDRDWN